MKTFTEYQKTFATNTGNASITASSTNVYDNTTWGIKMICDSIRYLATKFYLNEVPYIVPGGTITNTNNYALPSDFEQMVNVTIQVGNILYQPKESPSKKHFDLLNIIPFYNDYSQYWFIFNNKLYLYPIPASSSNVITINYKKRIVDIAMDDVTEVTSSTTVSATNGNATITAAGGTPFAKWMAINGWIRIPFSATDAQSGDNQWYKIDSVQSATSLTLKNQYTGVNVTGAKFTIGDVPILPEDYQDLPLYRACRIYFTTRVPDPNKAKEFAALYNEGYAELNAKYGAKDSSPVLEDTEATVYNPNLFPRNLG